MKQASVFEIGRRNPDGTFEDSFDCKSGELLEQDINPTSTNAGIFYTFDFDQCVLENETRDGRVSGQDGARGLQLTTDAYSVWKISENNALYSGYAQIFRTQSAFFDSIHSFDTTGFSVNMQSDGEALSLDQMTTSFGYGSQTSDVDKAYLNGGFITKLPFIDESTLIVETPIEFEYALNTRADGQEIDGIPAVSPRPPAEQRNNWTFTRGQLYLEAKDGSSLLLDADNGDPASVTISITSDNSTVVFDQPWSLWRADLRFADYPNIVRVQ